MRALLRSLFLNHWRLYDRFWARLARSRRQQAKSPSKSVKLSGLASGVADRARMFTQRVTEETLSLNLVQPFYSTTLRAPSFAAPPKVLYEFTMSVIVKRCVISSGGHVL